MHVRFVTQPFDNGYDARDFLLEVLADQRLDRLDVAVVWAKRSGLRIVDSELRAFIARGGTVRIIAGVDEGGGAARSTAVA